MKMPDWLKETDYNKPLQKGRGHSTPAFINRTINHIVSFTKDTMFSTSLSFKKGLLQAVEPRLKLICLLAFIVALSLERHLTDIMVFLASAIILAVLSRIPLLMLFKRLLPVLLFTALIALPSMLNLIVEGEAVVTLFTFEDPYKIGPVLMPDRITITKTGMATVATLVLRVTTSVLAVFLQTMTTHPEKLIKAVSFFLPETMKHIFSISYRYIFFLIKRLEEFITAYRARNIQDTSKGGRRWVGSRIAVLFSISLKLSRDLQMTMESRGYTFQRHGLL